MKKGKRIYVLRRKQRPGGTRGLLPTGPRCRFDRDADGGGRHKGCAMRSLWKKLLGGGQKDPGEGKGQYGVDYVGVSELMRFNSNLIEALKHERSGIALYTRFLDEANDERGREMYRKLLEEEQRHIRMVEEEIKEHKEQGYWG